MIKVYWWNTETNPLSYLPSKKTPKKLLLEMMPKFRQLYPLEQAIAETLVRRLDLYNETHSTRTRAQYLLITLTMKYQTKTYLVPPIPTVREIRNQVLMLVLRVLALDPVTQATHQALPS